MLVRHGQASQGEPNPELFRGLASRGSGSGRERSASGALEPLEGVTVTATAMIKTYALRQTAVKI